MTPLIDNALLAIQEWGNDENATIEMFDRLHKAGEKISPTGIKEWAQMNNWDKKDAERLGKLATTIINGETIIKKYQYWNDDILRILMA